jgi:phosphopantothenoylcysteine decarboxylase/phosphopantothenate--cysteine ligase
VATQARKKRKEKGVDLIVANDVSRRDAGFEVDSNEVTIVSADGEETVPLQSKAAVANRVLDRVEALLKARTRVLS